MFTYITGQQIKSQLHKKFGDAMKVVSPAIKNLEIKPDENSKENRNFNHSNFSCDYIP